jgi:hypothetical protein
MASRTRGGGSGSTRIVWQLAVWQFGSHPSGFVSWSRNSQIAPAVTRRNLARGDPRCQTCGGRGWTTRAAFDRCRDSDRQNILRLRMANGHRDPPVCSNATDRRVCCNATDTMRIDKGQASGGDAPFGSRGLATTNPGERPPVLQRRSGSQLEVAVNSCRAAEVVRTWRIMDCGVGCRTSGIGTGSGRIMWQLAVWQCGSHLEGPISWVAGVRQ